MTILALIACSNAPEQLEAIQVDAPIDEALDEQVPWEGLASIEGADKDWTLDLDGETFTTHSPTAMDLSTWDGQELTVSVTTTWSGHPDGLALYDSADLAYASVGSDDNDDVIDRFGADFASWGEELGRTRGDSATYTYRAVQFQTDTGSIELAPGEVAEIVVDGVTWQVAPVASYDHEYHRWAMVPACGGGGPMLSYEIMRVDAPTGEDRFIGRADGMAMAKRSCG